MNSPNNLFGKSPGWMKVRLLPQRSYYPHGYTLVTLFSVGIFAPLSSRKWRYINSRIIISIIVAIRTRKMQRFTFHKVRSSNKIDQNYSKQDYKTVNKKSHSVTSIWATFPGGKIYVFLLWLPRSVSYMYHTNKVLVIWQYWHPQTGNWQTLSCSCCQWVCSSSQRRSGKIDQNLNFEARVEISISFSFCS